MSVKTSDKVIALIQRLFTHNFIELGLLTVVAISYPEISGWLLWTGFWFAGIWTLTVSSRDSEDYAQELVLDRELFITDFVSSAVILTALAWLVKDFGWQFWGMYLVAVGQNLRYTYLSIHWLMEEKRDRERLGKEPRDTNLP